VSSQVLEIYTKRNFRCDCGNSKYPHLTCKVAPDKEPLNEKNTYNQNYTGLYCTCHRPYPDLDRDEEGETMFQCVVCEDWLHVDHLGLKDEEEVGGLS
jgi:E3 ubiquitin-protein ligase UBR7